MRRPPDLAWLVVLAIATRTVVALRTEVPDWDAASYLWMAEQAAAGRADALFATTFHPLYSAIVAGLLAVVPGLDGVVAGQLVSAGFAAVAVIPLYLLAEARFGRAAAMWTGVLYAVGTWYSRYPADCLSEGPFYLFVASCALCLPATSAARVTVAGACAAAAYATRPEGAALWLVGAPWLIAAGRRLDAARFTLGFGALAMAVPLGYAAWGNGFTLSPKAEFAHDATSAADGFAYYLGELARVPGAILEDQGFVVLPLVVYGVVRWPPRSWTDARVLWLGPFLIQCAVVPALKTHYRFFSGFGLLLLPFAGVALAHLLERLRRRHAVLSLALAAAVLAVDVVRLPHPRRVARALERELGRHLGSRLAAGATIATDMPRVAYYAGVPPGPPRRLTADDLLRFATDPATRIVAWIVERTPLERAALTAENYAPLALPAPLSAATAGRGVEVWSR